MSKNILIVGSGRRVQNNFLPLLEVMSDRFEVVGIVSRSFENAQSVADLWGLAALRSLAEVDWQKVDVVVVSVTPQAVPDVLRQIAGFRKNLEIVVDTPALLTSQLMRASDYSKFKSVLVAEDFMNFPQFELMRLWARLHGPVEKIEVKHAGYDFHAFALARSFAGFQFAEELKQTHENTDTTKSNLVFPDNTHASITMPYRRATGSVTIHTATGVLHWSPNLNESDTCGQTFVRPQFRNGVLSGFQAGEVKQDLPYLQWLLDVEELEDKSLFNLLKICGLIRVFEAMDKPNLNNGYGVMQGIYDSALSRLMKRDHWLKTPALSFLPMLASRALPPVVVSKKAEFRRRLEKNA